MFARTLIPFAVGAVALSGCLGGSNRDSRAGGQRPPKVTTLVLATALGSPDQAALEAYAKAVAGRSGGTLKIKLQLTRHEGDPAAESKLLGEVHDGKYALAMVGARVLDTAGVRSFQALLAPGLVQSVKLENDVLAGAVGDQMLAGVKPAGVTGVGLFTGPLRRMLGVTRDFRTPEDFAGARVGLQQSEASAATLRALGAKPVPLPAGADISHVDGYEQQLASAFGNGYARVLHSISTPVLWPRPLVVIGNPDALAELSERQREALTAAVPAGRAAFAAVTARDERDAVTGLCRAGVHFVPFSPRALVEATQPVYAQLERDPATKRFLEQIQAMDASPDPAPKCTATQPTQARDASTLDGVYHMYTSKKELARQDDVAVADATPENWGDWYLVIDRGRFVWTQQNPESCTWAYGTAILKGGQITWNVEDGGGISPTNSLNKPGERFVFKSRLYRGTLTLEAIEPADFTTEHWTRKSDRPSQDVFFHRCPPPAEAQVG